MRAVDESNMSATSKIALSCACSWNYFSRYTSFYSHGLICLFRVT